MSDDSYDQGVRDGTLDAMEKIQAAYAIRLDKVEGRVSNLERVAYTLLGAVALVQFGPTLKAFLG